MQANGIHDERHVLTNPEPERLINVWTEEFHKRPQQIAQQIRDSWENHGKQGGGKGNSRLTPSSDVALDQLFSGTVVKLGS